MRKEIEELQRQREKEERLLQERELQEKQKAEEEELRQELERLKKQKMEEENRVRAKEEEEKRRKEEEELLRKKKQDEEKIKLTNSIGMEFVKIPAGDFMMGSNESVSEQPVHKVTIQNPFYLSKYPVTQKQWVKVMGSNPSHFKGDDLPVETVSWEDALKFLKKLNEMEGKDEYRLPSEAEWEYACRAGTTTKYSFGDTESKLGDYAWYSGYAAPKEWRMSFARICEVSTRPVGQKNPNPWGLYDMHGNVLEWVQDRWHDNYEGAPPDGGSWESGSSSDRVMRGGGWHFYAWSCRSAHRDGGAPGARGHALGFRLLRKL